MKYILFFSLFLVCGYAQTGAGEQHFEASEKFVDTKEYDKALESADAALKADMSNRNYLLQKIKVLSLKSECETGLTLLQSLMEKEGVKDDTMFYFCTLGDCMKESEAATDVLIDYVKSKKYTSHDVLTFLAQRLFYENRYDESIQYYTAYLKLEPKNILAIIDLSRIVYAYKGSSAGIDIIKEAIDVNPKNVDLLNCLSAYYYNEKEYDKALDVVNKIIQLDNNENSIASRAAIYMQQGRKDLAYQDYKALLKRKDCVADYYSMILQYEYDNRMYEENIESSYKLIECNSAYKEVVLDGLYTSLFFCNDFKKGTEYLNDKLALHPDNFNPYYTKTLILFQDKEYREIPKYLDLALQTKDVEKTDIANIEVLRMAYYLIVEDFDGFAIYWKNNDVKKTLENNLSFTIIEEPKGEKAELQTVFDKKYGVIKSSFIVPTKVFRLLRDKYGLTFDFKN